jgi:hypothetical protein
VTIPIEGDPPEVEQEEVDPNVTEFSEAEADTFFGAVMDSVAVEPDPAAAGEGGEAADPPAGGDGQATPPGEGAPPAAGEPAAPAAGAGEQRELAPDAGTSTRDAADFEPNWAAAIEGLEKRQTDELTAMAVAGVKTEYAQYLEAVEQAPRYLVGKTVPKADGSEGTERLNDAQDARDWQDEIKKQLAREVQSRVRAGVENNRTTMEVLHNSIELFRGNPDIVPNTKQFDKELAERFASLVEPYAIKTQADKTAGWSIDVRPLLKTARDQLATERAKNPATPPAPAKAAEPTAQQQRAAQQQRTQQGKFAGHPADNPAGPQAGITSQAGTSGDDEGGLDTLFGTLGFPPGTFRF